MLDKDVGHESDIEQEITPEEQKAQLLVGQVERAFIESGILRRAEERKYLCSLAAELVQRSAEKMGIESHIFYTKDVHEKLRSNLKDENSFKHLFNIVKIGDFHFLIDESFGQYVTSDEEVTQWEDKSETIGTLEDHPIGYSLVRNGYVFLDDEALRDYLKSTTEEVDLGYLSEVKVDEVFEDPSLHVGITRDEGVLDNYLSGEFIDSFVEMDDLEA